MPGVNEVFDEWFSTLKTAEESPNAIIIPMEVAVARRQQLTEDNLGWKIQIRQEKLRLW